MKKSFGKKDFIKMKSVSKLSGRSSHSKWMAVCVFVAIFVFLCLGLFVYQPKKVVLASSGISDIYVRFNNWMHERNHKLQQKIVKVKQLAVNNKTPQQEIHFEFYTALPGMKVPIPDVNKSDATVRPVVVTNALVDAPSLSKVVMTKKIKNGDAIFDADKLQNALRAEFNSTSPEAKQYIVQMGVFKNIAGAEKFLQTLAGIDSATRIVAKRKGYSVQAGPFQNKNQAVLMQRQLQKKNVNGIIQKI